MHVLGLKHADVSRPTCILIEQLSIHQYLNQVLVISHLNMFHFRVHGDHANQY